MSVKINRFNLGFKYFGPKEYCSTGEFMSFAEHTAKMQELRNEHANYRKAVNDTLAEKMLEISQLQNQVGILAGSESFWNNLWNASCKENQKLRAVRTHWKNRTITVLWVAFFYALWAVINCLRYAFGG